MSRSIDDAAALTLPRDQVHLWLTPDYGADGELLARYRQLLSPDELAQERRFVFAKDRIRYLITRTLVRTVLSRYATIDPRDWRFQSNKYGRPAIANERLGVNLDFNLSHTAGLIVVAMSQSAWIGVDTESLDREALPLDVADQYFSRAETLELRSQAAAQQPARFLEYWTLKESYIKAQGKGLSIGLDRFSFDLTRDRDIGIEFHEPYVDVADRWHFWLLRAASDHLIAVCVDCSKVRSQQLVLRQAVPMMFERRTDCVELRRSSERVATARDVELSGGAAAGHSIVASI